MKLKNKVVLVTGGGTGIGRAIALLFAKEGAKVVCASRRSESCGKTAEDIRKAGGEAIAIPTDVSKSDQVQRMVEVAVKEYGTIDILVNNAGILTGFVKVGDITEEQFDAMFAVNVKGQFLTAKYCLPVMIANDGGVIVSTSSTSAITAQYSTGVYNATKAADLFLTKNISLDYAEYGIRANCLCPGFIDDTVLNSDILTQRDRNPDAWEERLKLYPLKRIGTPDDVAKAALFLASDESSYITGTMLIIDGGYTCV